MMHSATAQLRVAWLAVTLVALLGFAAVVLPAEQRISAIETHAAQLGDLATRNEVLLQRLESLKQTRARVQSDLRRLVGKSNSGRVGVAVLRILDGEAKRNHLTISSIAPAGDLPSAQSVQREEDVEVTLRGRYRDVMSAVADVPHHDALVEIRSVSLARVDSRQVFPSVDATIRAALYHDVKDLITEDTHAQTAAQ